MRIETPRGAVFKTPDGSSAVLEWDSTFQPKWEGRYNRGQTYVDTSVLRYCDPYLPFRSGFLKKTGILGTVVGSGEVAWIAPYARYLYYGKVMAGRAPKTLTGHDLQYDRTKNPLAGSFWFERAMGDHKDTILAGARRIAGGS